MVDLCKVKWYNIYIPRRKAVNLKRKSYLRKTAGYYETKRRSIHECNEIAEGDQDYC